MKTLTELKRPFFVLAPMDDVTDTVFRQMVADLAPPDLMFTEFVNVDGLSSPGRGKLLPKLRFTDQEQPLIAQVWGKHPENYYSVAKELVEMGFTGIDINMGCPVKTVVRNGCCSALISNRGLAVDIIKATQEGAGGKVPVSVKTRLGHKDIDMSWPSLLLQQKLNMLTIHGRTVHELSAVPAHWDQIGKVRELRDELDPNTLIVGNGDVASRAQGMELAGSYQLDGIMIGRGVFNDPYVFAKSSPWQSLAKEQKIELYQKHVELFQATWQHEERKIHTLNKFCKVYINGFDGAKELRERLMACNTADELLRVLEAA